MTILRHLVLTRITYQKEIQMFIRMKEESTIKSEPFEEIVDSEVDLLKSKYSDTASTECKHIFLFV